jgi:hemin uptake protein HemP
MLHEHSRPRSGTRAVNRPPTDAADEPKAADPPRISSRDLLAGHREIVIEHGREEYRLRLTGTNKLILTK